MKNECHKTSHAEKFLLSISAASKRLRSRNPAGRCSFRDDGINKGKEVIFGFTLIELLVVVLIVGILAAVAVPQYQKAVRKSQLTEMFVLAKAVKDAEERHYMANGEYTLDWGALDISLPSYCHISGKCASCSKSGYAFSINLSLSNSFSSPQYYGLYIQEGSNPRLLWHWQLDQAASWPGKRLCYAYKSDGEKGKDLCKSLGGKSTGSYVGWYPDVAAGYVLE